MDPRETNRVHATLIWYQHWSPTVLVCKKEQSTMLTDTGDDSGATDRESTEPPIGVVGNTDREVTDPPIVVVRATGIEVREPPIGVVDAVAIHYMTTRKKAKKKNRFTWSHHGTKPNCGLTYIVNEWNYKDKILIRHLLADQPWKAHHGCIMSAWDSLLEKLLTEKRDGACVFEGVSVITICKQYEQVYLYLGKIWTEDKEKRNQEEASEDEELDTDTQRTTKQLIKQGIMDLYEESIQHEEELESEKQEEKQQDAHGKMAAIHIREAALGRLRQKNRKTSYKEQSTSSSSTVDNEATADATENAAAEAGDNTSGCSNNDISVGIIQESPLIRNKKGPTPTQLPSLSKKQHSASDVDMVLKNAVRNSSGHQERMIDLQEKKMEYKKQQEDHKRLAEENREKEMDLKQQELDMEHEQHKAVMEAQQASQQVNMKMLDFLVTLTTKFMEDKEKENKYGV